MSWYCGSEEGSKTEVRERKEREEKSMGGGEEEREEEERVKAESRRGITALPEWGLPSLIPEAGGALPLHKCKN